MRLWNVSLRDQVDASRKTPIYAQIIQALIREIESGRLVSNTFLPSSRELAIMLGVNRKTVVLAYDDLISQGWLTSSSTRGTMVSPSLPTRDVEAPFRTVATDRVQYQFAAAPARALALPAGSGLKLDEGAPDGRLFSTDQLSRAYRGAIQRASHGNRLQYRDPRGSELLRDSIAAMLRSERGLQVTREHICITRGSQNSIFLAVQLLVKPGDAVIVEELTYEPAVAALIQRGARILPVPLDADGLDMDAVERMCRQHRVRAIFVTPHHQFPTTVALRPERRLRLLELTRQFGFAIIEDDYDHEFHFDSQPLLPMAAYAPDKVVYAGSLSKLLLPALRIGYIAAPVPVIDAIAHLISTVDGMGNTMTEEAVAELIESGEVRRHARKVRQIYATRRERFAEMLTQIFGDLVQFDLPQGGLAFWIRLAADLDSVEAGALRTGLRFASHRSYMAHDAAPRGLRLGFASLTPEEARTALGQLRAACRAD